MKKGMSVKHIIAGSFFLLLWLASQRISASPVLSAIGRVADSLDSGDLLAAASFVAVLNGVRAIALYLGWFLLGSGIASLKSSLHTLSWIIPVTAIPLTYFLLPAFGEGIQIHFGIPAVLSVTTVLVLRYLTREISDWGYKSLALALFVFSFQWLDILPFLTPYGAGWGELSLSVKTAAELLRKTAFLNRAGSAVFAALFLSGVLTTELLVSYGARLASLALLRDREQKMALLREKNLSARIILEMQQLVHDLKRPLTTILGLADVIVSGRGGEGVEKYGTVIAEAGRSMEEMIAEILHGDSRRSISLGDLLEYVFTQISPFSWRETVSLRAEKSALAEKVTVNVVRLSRAVVNLLDNAHRANLETGGNFIEIILTLSDDWAEITVADRGPGFPSPERGSSGWNSTGLGLQYVTMVAENHGGRFLPSAAPEGGALASILLPIYPEKKETC